MQLLDFLTLNVKLKDFFVCFSRIYTKHIDSAPAPPPKKEKEKNMKKSRKKN
jgi:hypothetical protein